MILYEALYNYMTEESGYVTLSVHKTKQGARNAVAKVVREEREKHNKLYKYDREEMPYIYGEFEGWMIKEIEVQE